ncbi:MAG: PKD domain-containing protein, partial [bacterium]
MREIKKEEIKGLRQIEEKVKGIFWSCGSVENKLPVPIITGRYTGYEGMPISLDGSSSYDLDGTITTYIWEIDGISYDGSMTTIVIDDDYIGSLTLRVIDNDQGEAETQTTITILNLNPQITLSSPSQGKVNYPIQFIAEVFDTDPITFLWDFGDLGTSSEQNPTHTYTNVGIYPIPLIATDDDGGSTSATAIITISEVKPEIEIAPKSGYIGEIITITGLGFGGSGLVSIDFGTHLTITTTISNANGTFSTTFMVNTQPPCTKIITARDAYGNYATTIFNLLPQNLPDLIVEKIKVSPSHIIKQYQRVRITAFIKNIGKAEANLIKVIFLDENNQIKGTKTIGHLFPGQTQARFVITRPKTIG